MIRYDPTHVHLTIYYTPRKLCLSPANFVCGGYTVFTLSMRACVCVCVRVCVRPSVTFCFFNILKSHCWIFIKPCKHVHICKTNTLDKKVRAMGPILLELFPFVVLNGFLYRVLCLCYYRPYTGRSTPTTAFDGTL